MKNFEHFWLNEGISTFIERKIGGRSKGEPYRHLRAIGGIRDLRQTVGILIQMKFFLALFLFIYYYISILYSILMTGTGECSR